MMRIFQLLSVSLSLLFLFGCVAPGTVLKSTQKRGEPVIETVSADPAQSSNGDAFFLWFK